MDLDTMLEEESFQDYLMKKADMHQIPMMGTFELTPVCNMQCKMCYIQQTQSCVESKGGLRSIDFWNRVIDQAIDEGMLFCLLTGGEILTYPDFPILYNKLAHKGIGIVLNTNGTLLNEKIVSVLAQHPPKRLNISLYGASDETYQNVCNYPDGFQKVLRGMDLLKKYNIPFRIHGVLIPENIHDYEKIKELCNYYNTKLQLSYYMFPPIRKELNTLKSPTRFSPEKMAEVALMYRREQTLTKENWIKFVEQKCHFIEHPSESSKYGITNVTCRAGCSSFWINWRGELSGCGVEDSHFTNLSTISFHDAWHKIVSTTKQISLSERCSVCCYQCICPTCMAAAYCETGQINGTPEYLCAFSKKYGELLLKERDIMRRN